MQDVLLDRGSDPPHRVRCEPEPAIRIEPLHRLHDAHIALGDQLPHRQAVATVPHGDLCHEPQM